MELRSSTYEGKAMNAAVPAGVEPIADMVPIYSNGWVFDSSWYADSTSYVRVRRVFYGEGESAQLKVRLLDYAARGEIAYYPLGMPYEWMKKHIRPIPRCANQFLSNADPDSDGLTLWEEYRGFRTFDSENLYFRLDTTLAETKRQVIVIDQADILEEQADEGLVKGFTGRLCDMMACSLIVENEIYAWPVVGHCSGVMWDWYERIDIMQGRWDSLTSYWVPNGLSIPDPPYSHPAPADSTGLVRSSDQVAIRMIRESVTGVYAACCHRHSDNPLVWGYGICGTSGITYDANRIRTHVYNWWPGAGGWDANSERFDSTLAICYRRNIAHELGHAIGTPDHGQYQWEGNNCMCVMMNIMWRTDLTTPQNLGEWMDWYYVWRDIPSQENHRWGYYDDDPFLCRSSIHHRP